MIEWISGTFGVGKTTTESAVSDRTDWRGFDPEHVGYQEAELPRRIENDEVESQALEWLLDQLAHFKDARPWLTQSTDLVLDTTDLTPEAAAQVIIEVAEQARTTAN